jgi:hypothetical protein
VTRRQTGAAGLAILLLAWTGLVPGQEERALAAEISGVAHSWAIPDPIASPPASAPHDTIPARPIPRYVLEPVVATGERELATPPPVVTRRVDRASLVRTPTENPWQTVGRAANLEILDPGQGPGMAPNAVLRGFASDHSTELLLVIDGVPVNLPVHGHAEGYSDWNVLLPGAVRTFRIIHGPASPLYGDYSISGAVEVFTHPDHEGTAGGLTASSHGDVEGWLLTGFRGEGKGGVGGVQLRRNEGWRDNSRSDLLNASFRSWREVGGAKLEAGVHLHGAEWDSPGFLPRLWYTERRLTEAVDPTDGGRAGRAVVQGRMVGSVAPDLFVQAAGWGLFADWENFAHVPGHGAEQRGERDRRGAGGALVELLRVSAAGEFTLGVEAARHQARYDLLFTREREILHTEARVSATRSVAAGYVRWRQALGARVGLDLGARVEALGTAARDRGGATPGRPDGTGGFEHELEIVPGASRSVNFSPKLGARWLVTDRSSLIASAARGLRSAQGVMGDPERPPVRSWTFEMGLEHDRGVFQGDLALFRTHVSNERIRDPLTTVVGPAGNSVRQGVEAHLGWTPTTGFRLETGAAYTHSTYDAAFFEVDEIGVAGMGMGGRGAGETPSGVSPLELPIDPTRLQPSFHVGIPQSRWVPGIQLWRAFVQGDANVGDRISLRAEARAHGPYVPVGEPYHETDPYVLVGAGFTVAMAGDWFLDLDGSNLLGRVYPAVRASGFVVPGTPRTFRLGVRRLPD